MTTTQKPAKQTAEKFDGFTDEERGAMKARAQELKASARRGSRADKAAEEEAAVVAKIAEMQDADRVMAERIHAVIKKNVPELAPKLWYGMPSYAKDGKVVCFFQSAQKFSARYATFGFSDKANLDDGAMWPTSYALTELTADDEARLAALVRKAMD
ncbi:iron chaperone [Streptomyces sp. NPDC054855]